MLQNDASQTGSAPDARNDLDTLSQCDLGPATGNTISGAGTVTGTAGADVVANGPATIVAVNGVESAGGTIQVEGTYGTLTIQSDGSYSYARSPNAPDGVSDIFTYTLADASGARDTATLTIDLRCEEDQEPEQAQQTLVTTEDGVVMLPAGVELSDIRVVGRDLVITLPDGSTMTIPGGAVFVPQLVIGDVEVPPANLAALLIEQEPQPASGTPQSSGGNFIDPVPPLDPGVPLGDLIPPTEMEFPEPTFEEVGQVVDEEPEITIQPDGQPASVNAVDAVEEAGLPERNDGEPAGSGESADGNGSDNDDGSETVTGTIHIDSPDEPSVVTINGVAVTAVGQQIEGEFGTLTITSISGSAIGYSYTLTDNTSGNDTSDFFTVTVTDSDGDSDTATLTINIVDDVPTAVNDTDSIAAGEFGPVTGNVITDADAGDEGDGDDGADTVGADDASLTSVSGAGGSDSSFNGDGNLVVEGEYGVLTIAADGSYSYVRNAGTPGGVTDTFTYTLTDGDGDTDTATLTIDIGDLTPEAGENPAVLLDDDALPGGNDGGPGDDPDSVNADGTLSGSGGDGALTFELQTTGAPDGFTYVAGPDGSVLVQQNGVTVLTVTVDPETGDYNVTQNAPIDHPTEGTEDNLSFTINYTVTDVDGDSDSGSLTINVDDDTPVIERTGETAPTLNVDETNLAANATGNFSGLFSVSYGADGAGTTLFSLSVVNGTDSGLVDVATGESILLFNNDGVIEGRVGGEDGAVAFTVSVDAETGVVTLDQVRALDHPNPNNPDDSVSPDPTSIQLTVEATDADGDPVSETINIGGNLSFDDDGPSVSGVTAAAGVTLDETEAGSPAGFPISATSAGAVISATTAFGADGAGSVTYGLSLQGGVGSVASGLATAIGDHPITLVQVDADTIEGRYEDGGTQVAFTIEMNADGTVTVTQEVPLEHLVDGSSAAAHDDALDLGDLVNATVTVTDRDGDTVTGEAAIGDNIVFEDDGPSINVTADADAGVVLQTQDPDTIGGASDSDSSTADFSGVFDAVFDGGADGAAGAPDLDFALGLSEPGVNSGLTQGGAPIFLYLIGGVVVGSTSATQAGVNAGNTVFDVSVDGDGVVTLTQHGQIDHPIGSDPDATDAPFADHVISIADELITLTASGTVTDNDGDTDSDSATVNIGANLQFGDDGPDISVELGTRAQIRVDETDGETAAGEVDPVGGNLGTVTVAGATLFNVTNVHTSADSPTTLSYALTLSSQGVASGLLQSADNAPIFLYNIGGVVYGSTATDIGDVDLGSNVAFTVSIDSSTGDVTVTQYLAVEHSDTTSNDELSSALNANVLNVTVTATDFDGDTDSDSVDLGSVIRFEDDGPSATQNQVTGTVDEDGVVEGADDGGTGDGIAGGIGDVAGEATVTSGSVTSLFASGSDAPLTFSLSADTSGLPALTSNGVAVTYAVAGNTLTASAGGETVFTFTLNANGSWTFTLVDQIDHAPGGNENNLTIALGSVIEATDADGDTVTANSNGLVITVDDDTPVARNDTDAIVSGGTQTSGNVITGTGTTSGAAGADSTGADAPATITAISGSGGTDTTFTAGVLEIDGDHGTLQIDSNGNYTYTRDAGSPGNAQDVFTYTYTDADGDSVTATLTINISDAAPVLTAPPLVQLDDDALGGNTGGTGDDADSVNAAGTLSASGGDGDIDFFFSGTSTLPAGFTFNQVDASTVQILQGATVVLTITLNNETGGYTVVQNNPIDHPSLDGLAGDNTENNLSFSIGLVAEDADGDESPVVNLTINVDDDTPVATTTQLTEVVDEDGVVEGAADAGEGDGIAGGTGDVAGQPVSGTGNVSALFSAGADQPLTYSLLSNFAGLTAQNLTSGGVALSYSVSFAAGVYTLTASAGAETVFTFTLDATTGAYEFTLVDQLDHAPGANENDLAIQLGSIIQATDADGDSVTANSGTGQGLLITVDDDTPIATTTQLTGTVDEDGVVEDATAGTQAGDGIAGGTGDVALTPPENVTTGNIGTLFQSGADEPLTYSLANNFAALTAQNLTSGGVALTYSVSFAAGVYTLTASAGGETVFTFALVASTGAYTFTLVDQLDHAPLTGMAGDNTENELLINLSSIIQATDFDGDTVAAGPNGLIITVDDDMPVAIDPDPITTGLENEPGETATADLDVDGQIEDNVGADEPGIVQFANITNGMDSGLTSGGETIEYWLSNNGQTLEARINSTNGDDGTLIFQIDLNQNPSGTDTYTVEMFGTIDNGSGVSFDDLTSTSAGNVEFRGVGADDPTTEIDLLLSGWGSDDTSATVNTDSDSIGADNQSMNAGETIRIDFVTNLTSGAGTTSGFGFDSHVSSNQFLGMIPQVQGNQAQTVDFTVYALDTTVTETGNPDRDPDGLFSDSTITEITSVTVIGFGPTETNPVTVDISGVADGATVNVAYGISVTKNADGSVTFHGVQEGDQYGFGTGSGDFNAIVVEAHDEFDLGVFSIGVQDSGDPINLGFDLQLTDADGDTVVIEDALDITIAPDSTTTTTTTTSTMTVQEPLADKSSLQSSNDNFEQQLKSVNAANSNTVFLGAIAAAGLTGSPAAAHSGFAPHADFVIGGETAIHGLAPMVRSIAFDADSATSMLVDKGGAAVQDASVPNSGSSQSAAPQGDNSLAGEGGEAAAAAAPLPGGTDAPAQAQASDVAPAAMSVAMPSAEMLAAAAAATIDGQQAQTGEVGRVLADALAGGGDGPNIDALIDALAPNADGQIAALEAAAANIAAAVPAWDMAAFASFAVGHPSLSADAMVMSPDAAQLVA